MKGRIKLLLVQRTDGVKAGTRQEAGRVVFRQGLWDAEHLELWGGCRAAHRWVQGLCRLENAAWGEEAALHNGVQIQRWVRLLRKGHLTLQSAPGHRRTSWCWSEMIKRGSSGCALSLAKCLWANMNLSSKYIWSNLMILQCFLQLSIPFTSSPVEVCSEKLLHLVQVLYISADLACRHKLAVVLRLTVG